MTTTPIIYSVPGEERVQQREIRNEGEKLNLGRKEYARQKVDFSFIFVSHCNTLPLIGDKLN